MNFHLESKHQNLYFTNNQRQYNHPLSQSKYYLFSKKEVGNYKQSGTPKPKVRNSALKLGSHYNIRGQLSPQLDYFNHLTNQVKKCAPNANDDRISHKE